MAGVASYREDGVREVGLVRYMMHTEIEVAASRAN